MSTAKKIPEWNLGDEMSALVGVLSNGATRLRLQGKLVTLKQGSIADGCISLGKTTIDPEEIPAFILTGERLKFETILDRFGKIVVRGIAPHLSFAIKQHVGSASKEVLAAKSKGEIHGFAVTKASGSAMAIAEFCGKIVFVPFRTQHVEIAS